MKQIISLILICAMLLSLCACGNTESKEEQGTEKESIELTKNNIMEYVKFDGEFTNGTYTKGSFVNWAEATLEFQAYPVAAGQFNNVEITLIASSDDHTFTYMNSFGNYWHLAEESDAREIRLTFNLSVNGEFSKNYSVECSNNTGELSGNCNFTVSSVSGTFIPD